MAKAEKIKLGALKVSDKGCMDRNEIVAELVDAMQKYVVQADDLAKDASIPVVDRYNGVVNISGRFCGLSEFLNCALQIEVRNPATGMLYTQEMYNRIHYHETMLKIEMNRAGE